MWYPASKTLAEKAAWKFAEENGLDVVVVNPGTVLGPMIPPTINASMAMFRRLLEGKHIAFAYTIVNNVLLAKVGQYLIFFYSFI